MSIFNLSEHISKVSDDAKKYLNSSLEYYKLDSFKKMMDGAVSLVNLMVSGSIFLIFILFFLLAIFDFNWFSNFFSLIAFWICLCLDLFEIFFISDINLIYLSFLTQIRLSI